MRIISQDKTLDIPYENFSIVSANNVEKNVKIFGYAICSTVTVERFALGEYKTLDRAKEVLAEIRGYYSRLKEIDFLGTKYCYFSEPYFEMPQE